MPWTEEVTKSALPLIISETNRRGETGEAAFESSRRDARNPCFNSMIQLTYQVKARSKGKTPFSQFGLYCRLD